MLPGYAGVDGVVRPLLLLLTWIVTVVPSPALAGPAAAGATTAGGGLVNLSIEELGHIEITSVSRREESLSDVPASIHVITRQEIVASGVTSIPEALRLAPAVEVARNGSHSWTISLRGFSNNLSNKLLVLIDGRSVYSPLFAGVYWDVQDTLLEDVERIEVIAGPGGTVWGANAVNGVINIITRSAWDTRGGLAELGGGDEDDVVAGVRYGGELGDDLAGRVYLKRVERDASVLETGGAANDQWEMNRAGFRLDWSLPGAVTATLQGDLYDGEESALLRTDFTLGTLPQTDVPGTIDVSGHNLLGRWQRRLDGGGEVRLQAYYDHTERNIPGSFDESRHTGDLDLVHNLRLLGRHDLIWGAGFRVTSDEIGNSRFATFEPDSRTDYTYSLFVQDRINLYDRRVFLTLGTKVEHNDYSGFEYQPGVRLAWLMTDRQTLWSAVSRAVRIPARLNEDLELYAPVPGLAVPLYINVRSTDDFEPEELIAYELGYRVSRGRVSADVAFFYNDYDHLMTNEALGPPELVPGPPAYLVLPAVQGNGMRGATWGGSLDVKWQAHADWRLEMQFSHIDFDLELAPGSGDVSSLAIGGNSPKYQAGVYSYLDLPRGLTLFAGVRYVDELPSLDVPSYVAVDASLQWRISARFTGSLTLRNLNDPRHPEFDGGREIERSALVKLDWAF